MVDLKAKPFNLNDEEIKWVEETYNSLTLEEKIGQLFVLLKATPSRSEEEMKKLVEYTHLGGFRWQNQDAAGAYFQNTTIQKYSKVPVFVAANCDDGGDGCAPNGTFVATATEVGSTNNTENAYNLGYVCSKEASALAVNWMFNPIVDIYFNWRNTIVNTRSFSDDKNKVLENARAYIKGIKEANPHMACCAKHFPGDGLEELDHHLAVGINNLSEKDWEENYGYVYRNLINEGLESIMVGHIIEPALERKYNPSLKDSELLPGSLSKELLTDHLRGSMGFNGLIITDATHMIGFASVMKRRDALPAAIIAGCDMLLFASVFEEDFDSVLAAYKDGRLTEARLKDALYRILGLKAHLRLMDKNVLIPPEENLKYVGAEEHKKFTLKAADEGITLVKDTKHNLPLDPNKQKNCYVVYEFTTPNSKGFKGDKTKDLIKEELERVGFNVTFCPNFHDLENERGVNFMNMIEMMNIGRRDEFAKKYDFVLIVINVKGYAQENCVRLRWSINHSKEFPWYNEEVPTIAMSLNYTNHLIDMPNVHTFINAYSPNRINVRCAIEKMIGKSEFKGEAQDNVFCGRWDTRI